MKDIDKLGEKLTTKNLLNLERISDDSPILLLVDKLDCSTRLDQKDPKESIMHYGQICDHDDGYLCEHRLQFIVDFLKGTYGI